MLFYNDPVFNVNVTIKVQKIAQVVLTQCILVNVIIEDMVRYIWGEMGTYIFQCMHGGGIASWWSLMVGIIVGTQYG